MKRLILNIAAILVVAASPIAADLAFAQGRGGERGQVRGEGRGRGGDDGRRYESRGEGREEGRGYGRRNDDRRNYDRRDYERRRSYDGPPAAVYGPPRGVRPGGRLPPEYRAPPVADYPRYRLRPPPAGYSWRRAGDAFILTDREGRVFDVVPD